MFESSIIESNPIAKYNRKKGIFFMNPSSRMTLTMIPSKRAIFFRNHSTSVLRQLSKLLKVALSKLCFFFDYQLNKPFRNKVPGSIALNLISIEFSFLVNCQTLTASMRPCIEVKSKNFNYRTKFSIFA